MRPKKGPKKAQEAWPPVQVGTSVPTTDDSGTLLSVQSQGTLAPIMRHRYTTMWRLDQENKDSGDRTPWHFWWWQSRRGDSRLTGQPPHGPFNRVRTDSLSSLHQSLQQPQQWVNGTGHNYGSLLQGMPYNLGVNLYGLGSRPNQNYVGVCGPCEEGAMV